MEILEKDLQIAEQNKSSRRAAILMGGAALAGLALTRKAEAQYQGATLDNALLNFALNLEFLEAQYYTLATQGKTIDQVGSKITGNNGATGGAAVTPGAVIVKPTGPASCLVPFTTPLLQQFANEVAQDERNHVAYLQNALPSISIAMPTIDLYNSFNALAAAAGLGASFDPFASEANFLLGAFIFEDVGVTAYAGAAGLISSSTILDAAAGIMAVEAYHAGAIRTAIYGLGATEQAASQKIATFRSAFDGTGTDDIGVGTNSAGAATIVDADSNAIVFSRTTAQVLPLLYVTSTGAKAGGFFPSGLNGSIA